MFFSEVKVIAEPVKDITPINGYLDYPESLVSRIVALTTTDNKETENEKVYHVILVSSRGGADIDDQRNSRARLTGISQLLEMFLPWRLGKSCRCSSFATRGSLCFVQSNCKKAN